MRLYAGFVGTDAPLFEVNPLILPSDGRVIALDSKVSIDGNSEFRHPDLFADEEMGAGHPLEVQAKKLGLQYVKLDGDIGIMGNGAGLVMSTLDVVTQAGGSPANFLDAGGGASAESMAGGIAHVLSDPDVKVLLVNIFGGITRCDDVARGVLAALEQLGDVEQPLVVRLDGTGADTSMIMVPAPFTKDAILEAYEAGISTIVCITEGVPVHDMAEIYNTLYPRQMDGSFQKAGRPVLIGPNCPGLISPGKANVGIIPTEITKPGKVGLVSRSGTLTYQIMHELNLAGIGISTCVGIGGDPVIGTDFLDVIPAFAEDPDTEAIVFVGEIGGTEEQKVGRWISDNIPDTPVVAYIAGFAAP